MYQIKLFIIICSVVITGANVVTIPYPAFLKVENESAATFCCYSQWSNSSLSWYKIPNGDSRFVITNMSNKCSESEIALELSISPVFTTDTGIYTCLDTINLGFHYNCSLDVYVMPSYAVQSAVILVVNVVLFIIFITCFITSRVHEKRNMVSRPKNSKVTSTVRT